MSSMGLVLGALVEGCRIVGLQFTGGERHVLALHPDGAVVRWVGGSAGVRTDVRITWLSTTGGELVVCSDWESVPNSTFAIPSSVQTYLQEGRGDERV